MRALRRARAGFGAGAAACPKRMILNYNGFISHFRGEGQCVPTRGAGRSVEMIIRKSRNELDQMRKSGMLVWQILQDLSKMVEEGVTNHDLEVAAEKMMKDAGAKPAFKGYYTPSAGSKYPYVLCTSVNDQIVHGMPSAKTKLKKGDIVSIDTGVQLDGYFGDSAITVPVGEISDQVKNLLTVTQESLEHAISQAKDGNRLFDISGAVQKHVEANGFS